MDYEIEYEDGQYDVDSFRHHRVIKIDDDNLYDYLIIAVGEESADSIMQLYKFAGDDKGDKQVLDKLVTQLLADNEDKIMDADAVEEDEREAPIYDANGEEL